MLNQELHEIFASQKLTDLILVGYSDSIGGFKNFNPMMNSVFLKFDKSIIRLESFQQGSGIHLSISDESAYSSACPHDEDDEFMICYALQLYTRYETHDIGVAHINLFYDKESDVYRAIGIELRNHAGYLFFDPWNLSGILIGSYNQQDVWLENWKYYQEKRPEHFGDIMQHKIEFGS